MRIILLLLPLLWVVYAISQETPAMETAPATTAEATTDATVIEPPPQAPSTPPPAAAQQMSQTVDAPPTQPEIPKDIPVDVPTVTPEASSDQPPVFSPSNEAFIYDPTGKRDPFDPNLGGAAPEIVPTTSFDEPEEQEVVKRDRALEPLEGFDLAQIKVEAVIWDTKNPRAMVRDAQGGIHYVKIKSRIGKKDGFVVAIREGEVVVVEYTPDSNGQYVKTFKALELR